MMANDQSQMTKTQLPNLPLSFDVLGLCGYDHNLILINEGFRGGEGMLRRDDQGFVAPQSIMK